ncbi:CAP domain-containing protein [Oceanobacillus sp. FSL K6-2867]|uniref:CAP domain-containing protein n=1 Tax=Oceanobacillus sp. FSL K6-2867 TaxID=2954748 RepID=UPI0030DD3622
MRIIRNLFLLSLLAIAGFYVLDRTETSPKEVVQQVTDIVKEKRHVLESKISPEEVNIEPVPLEGNIFQWIGKSSDELKKDFGEPIRIDKSAYDYEWWVYTNSTNQYVQFGIEDDVVKTIFATGENLDTEPINIGQPYEEVNQKFGFTDEVSYNNGISSYTFRISEEDIGVRPLVKLNDSTFIQLYFDTFTDKLSSVRVLTADTLLKHRPYEIEYRGKLPDEPNFTDGEWQEIEEGMEQQIYDLTNIIRHRHGKSMLDWKESVSNVAFLHSKDMEENNYFSHYSLNGDGLKERLEAEDVFYLAAGENIAAQYPDAPAAMEGWLNSEGHREALLSDDYTHIGVGVYRLYYTQNFLDKPL